MHLALRFNSNLELVPWASLTPAEREFLTSVAGVERPPAIVRPRPGYNATIKIVDSPTAILLASFQTPVPFGGPSQLPAHLYRLLLDGLLEATTGGQYVTGPGAAILFQTAQPTENLSNSLAIEALRYASALPVDDARAVASRLYAFHAVPCTAKWKRALGSPGSVAEWLGLGPDGVLARKLAAHGYEEIEHPQWLAWHLPPHAPLPYKLYISPLPQVLPEAVAAVIAEGIAGSAGSCKVGRTLANILRPDKLILYFPTFDALSRTATRLKRKLRHLPAHGVPFTCPLDRLSILSWGSDPPHQGEYAGWAQGESWRAWIVRRLAGAIVEARRHQQPEPWRFALTKAAADGVDTANWTPRNTFWV